MPDNSKDLKRRNNEMLVEGARIFDIYETN